MQLDLPADWRAVLSAEFEAPYFAALCQFVDERRAAGPVYPAPENVFAALNATPLSQVRAVLVGQDPYHGVGQAHGLCFSVPAGVQPPPSLRNILKELSADLGSEPPPHGCLSAWAERGVLLLNTVLTVDAGKAGSHQRRGWERFTDAVIRAVDARAEPSVFVLWGGPAQKKRALLDARHPVIAAPHPSPLSAYRGFFGSRPFSSINRALTQLGREPIDFRLA